MKNLNWEFMHHKIAYIPADLFYDPYNRINVQDCN